MLDINYLYNGPVTHPRQAQYRLRMTEAVYQDKRQEMRQAIIWLIVAIAHLFIVIVAFAIAGTELTHELAQAPVGAVALMMWLIGDVVYISCFPKLSGDIQHQLDRLEGKISS